METIDLLRGARELIAASDHLAKRAYRDSPKCYCAFGAMIATQEGQRNPMRGDHPSLYDWTEDYYLMKGGRALMAANPEQIHVRAEGASPATQVFHAVTKWNDDPATNRITAIEAFDRAINLLEAAS